VVSRHKKKKALGVCASVMEKLWPKQPNTTAFEGFLKMAKVHSKYSHAEGQ